MLCKCPEVEQTEATKEQSPVQGIQVFKPDKTVTRKKQTLFIVTITNITSQWF